MHIKWRDKDMVYTDKRNSFPGRSLLISLLVILIGFGLAFMRPAPQTNPDTEPLIEVMRGLMQDMEQLNRGIWYEQYGLIDSAATAIAEHPKALVKERKAIAEALGPRMTQFVSYDQVVHHHSDSIAMAAQQKEMEEIQRHYQIVHQGCVNCHTDFRSDLRETLRELRAE